MKYIYTNITATNQTVLLATKNQDSVLIRTFTPGASIELDYQGLNLYVPNILSCMSIDMPDIVAVEEAPKKVKAPVVVPAVVVEPEAPVEKEIDENQDEEKETDENQDEEKETDEKNLSGIGTKSEGELPPIEPPVVAASSTPVSKVKVAPKPIAKKIKK